MDKKFRLENWNYSSPGSYFVTISTSGKFKYLGTLKDQKVHFNRIGQVAHQNWLEIPKHFPFVTLGSFVIMPDHVHGIIVIEPFDLSYVDGGTGKFSGPTFENEISMSTSQNRFVAPLPIAGKGVFGPQSKNLGSIIRGYKASVKAFATTNNLNLTWQSRYKDKILWNVDAFVNVSKYINDHPQPFNLELKTNGGS